MKHKKYNGIVIPKRHISWADEPQHEEQDQLFSLPAPHTTVQSLSLFFLARKEPSCEIIETEGQVVDDGLLGD